MKTKAFNYTIEELAEIVRYHNFGLDKTVKFKNASPTYNVRFEFEQGEDKNGN